MAMLGRRTALRGWLLLGTYTYACAQAPPPRPNPPVLLRSPCEEESAQWPSPRHSEIVNPDGTSVYVPVSQVVKPRSENFVPAFLTTDVIERSEKIFSISECLISESGVVQQCRVVKTVPGLDEKILAAIRATQYKPGMHQGRAVAMYLRIEICIASPYPTKATR